MAPSNFRASDKASFMAGKMPAADSKLALSFVSSMPSTRHNSDVNRANDTTRPPLSKEKQIPRVIIVLFHPDYTVGLGI